MAPEHLEYFKSLPPGYRFAPKDEELIQHYLSKKVKNQELPPNNIVEQNIYNYNPAYLAETYKEYGEKEWYFFTPRERKYLNGDRPNRSAGDGYWKATGADRPITREGMCIGLRKTLVFYKGQAPKGDKTNWIMHEFKLPKPTRGNEKRKNNNMRLDDWVLCRIYEKNERSSPKGRSNPDGDQSNDIDTAIIPAIVDQPDPSIFMHDQDHQDFVGKSISPDMPPLENEDGLKEEDDSLTNALNNFVFSESLVPFSYSSQQQQQQMPYNYMDNIKEEQQQQMSYNYMDNIMEEQQQEQMPYNYIQQQMPYNYIDNIKEGQRQFLCDYVDQNNFLPLSYSTVPPDPLVVLPPDHLHPLKVINYQYRLDGNVHGNVKLDYNHKQDTTFLPQSHIQGLPKSSVP